MILRCLHVVIPISLTILFNFVIGVVPAALLRVLGMVRACDYWVRKNTAWLCKCILFFMGADIEVTGQKEKASDLLKNGNGLVFVSNHCSIMDIPLVLSVFEAKTGFVAKKELAFVPFVNIFCLMLHCVFIDRKNTKKGVASIYKGSENIKNGYSMLIFPEGTRSKTGTVGSFKRGSFRLASENRATIIPLVIKGDRELFENRKKMFKKQKVYLKVLDPVSTKGKDRFELFDIETEIEKGIKDVYEQL